MFAQGGDRDQLPAGLPGPPGNAPFSTRAMIAWLTNAVKHPIKLTKPSVGVMALPPPGNEGSLSLLDWVRTAMGLMRVGFLIKVPRWSS